MQQIEKDIELKSGTLVQAGPTHLERPYQVDSGWRAWSSVVASFLQIAICLGFVNAFGIFQAEYKLSVFPGSSDMAISFIGSTNQASLSAGCLFAGRLSEVVGLRPISLLGSFLTVIALLASSWCNSVSTLIVTQGIVLGFASACLYVTAAALPMPWFEKKRSLAFGIIASGGGAGGLAWSYINRLLLSALGYQWTLRIAAFICLSVLSLSTLLMTSPPGIVSARKKGSFTDSLKYFKTEKWLLPFYIGFIFFLFGFGTPYFYMPSYIQSEGGASASTGSTISAVMNAGSIFGRVILGYAMDSSLGAMNTFVLNVLLTVVLQFAVWLPANGNLPASFIFAFLYGFTGSGSLGVSPAVLAKHLDHVKLASIIGVFYTSEIPGFVAGPPLSGAILSKAGYRAVIGFSGGSIATATVLFVVSRLMLSKNLRASV